MTVLEQAAAWLDGSLEPEQIEGGWGCPLCDMENRWYSPVERHMEVHRKDLAAALRELQVVPEGWRAVELEKVEGCATVMDRGSRVSPKQRWRPAADGRGLPAVATMDEAIDAAEEDAK